MPFLISMLFSINREEVFWGLCKETFQEKAHVGRKNAMSQSKKPVLFWQKSAMGHIFCLLPFCWTQYRQRVVLGKSLSERANHKNAVLHVAS